jgi:radical SAM superfamily enzyme YgiQ (UPF0313 family)
MKILLFSPPFEAPAQEAASYPLALGYLGTFLEENKHEVKAFDFLFNSWDNVKEKIEQIIKKEKPDIIGISSMTTNRTSSFLLTELAKKINPEIRVILGGVHPTIMYEQILMNFPVDFVVIGEGEHTFLDLVKAIEKRYPKSRLKKIKGIAFKEKNSVIKTEPCEFIRELDELPFPNHKYFSDYIKKHKSAYMTTSRGCPIGCRFCSTSQHWGRMKRTRSVKNVVKELKQLLQSFPQIKKIYFNDDEFIYKKQWVMDFCNELIKEKIKVKWECGGRVDSIYEDMVGLMKKAGCEQINFGVESGSDYMLKKMKKLITRKQIINSFSICEKYNIKAGIYLMVGLPGENKKTIRQTINLLKHVPNSLLNFPAIYQVYPGTEFYQLAKEQGFISDDFWLSEKPAPFYTYEHPKWKLLLWSLKISAYHKFYRGELFSFIFSNMKNQIKIDKIKRIIKLYIKK